MAKKKNRFFRRLPLIGIFLLMILGISFFMYPIVSNWYTEYSAWVTIREYDEAVKNLGDESIKRIIEQADEYNRTLAGTAVKSDALKYDEMLVVTDAIGYIEIPKIGVYYPIFRGLGDDVLQRGVGHMEGTSLPVGGESTHCVLAGHTGLPSSKMFTDIDTLENGDVFYIHVLDKVLKYRVDQSIIVLPHESENIRIERDKDYVTLVTCTPYGINSHRLLVRGERVKLTAAQEKEQEEDPDMPSYHKEKVQLPLRTVIWYAATVIMGVVVIGILAILLFPSLKKRKNKKRQADKITIDENNIHKTDQGSEDMEE